MSMPKMSATIRKAKKEDMAEVYNMIKELAQFENMEESLKLNVSTLEKDGFEKETPAFSCFVAEISTGQIVGYALYYSCYSTWLGCSIFLEDLYVREQYRKNGIGRQLFLAVAKIAQENPSNRLDFHVLKWNPAVDFYKKIGAVDLTVLEKWHLFRLDGENLNKLFLN